MDSAGLQPNVLFMECLFLFQLQCHADVGWHPTSVMKSQCCAMARSYITSHRLKQISFSFHYELPTDRFVLLGITLLFSESKQGREWALDCRGAVDGVDQPACLLVRPKATKQTLHLHFLMLHLNAVANRFWC